MAIVVREHYNSRVASSVMQRVTNVHARWGTQPRSAKFYHLKIVHGMDLHTTDRLRDPNELEISTGFLDDTHREDHRAPGTFLEDRRHVHTQGDF